MNCILVMKECRFSLKRKKTDKVIVKKNRKIIASGDDFCRQN